MARRWSHCCAYRSALNVLRYSRHPLIDLLKSLYKHKSTGQQSAADPWRDHRNATWRSIELSVEARVPVAIKRGDLVLRTYIDAI